MNFVDFEYINAQDIGNFRVEKNKPKYIIKCKGKEVKFKRIRNPVLNILIIRENFKKDKARCDENYSEPQLRDTNSYFCFQNVCKNELDRHFGINHRI